MPTVSDAVLGAATGLHGLKLSAMDRLDGSCFGHMRRLRRLTVWRMEGLGPGSVAALGGSLRELVMLLHSVLQRMLEQHVERHGWLGT